MTRVQYAPNARVAVTASSPAVVADGAHAYWGRAMTKAAAFAERDGAEIEHFAGKYWLLGGWDPVAPEWGGSDITTNEVWSSTDLITWTKELVHDAAAPTSGAGARWLPRHTHGTAVKDGYLWVIGGDTVLGAVPTDVWRSVNGTTWERVSATSPWAYLSILGVYNGYFHIMGGTSAPTQHWRSADGVTWTQLADMPFGRSSVTRAVVLAGKMYIAGGLDADGSTQMNDTWRYDGATWTRMSATATWSAREWVCTAAYDGKIWVLTGKSGLTNAGGLFRSSDGGVTYVSEPAYPYIDSHADGVTVTSDGIILAAGNANPGCVFRIRALPADPSVTMSTLAWTLWFDGATYNPVTPQIFGKASAGASGGRNLVLTSVPTQGEINGRPTIVLDGVDDVIRYTAGGGAEDVLSHTAWTCVCTLKINSSTSNSATPYINPGIISESGAWVDVGIRSSGVVEAYQDGGGATHADTTWTAGVLVHFQIKYDGTNLKIRKGKGAWTSIAKSAIGGALGPIHIGSGYNLAQHAGMEICEWAATNTALSDVTLDLCADDMARKWGVTV